MADADQIDLLYAEESTFATPPAAGTWKNVRLTGESLGQDTEYAQSAELRKDRQVVDQIRLDVSGSGDINYEFSYGAFDDFIEAVLMGTWDFTTASTQRTASIADASIASNVITAGSGTPFADFSIGMWVKLSNAGDPLNNGIIGKISTASDTVLTLTHCTLTDDASDTLDIDEMEFVTNGTTFRTFSFERIYTDIGTDENAQYLGMGFNTMGLTVAVGELLNGTFGLIGKKGDSISAQTDPSPTAAPTNPIMNNVDHVDGVLSDGTLFGITNFVVNVNNNLRARPQVGTLGAISLGTGKFNDTGTLERYYATVALMNKYLNADQSELVIKMTDTPGNSYVFVFPALRFTNGRRVAGGENTDILASMEWAGFMHPTDGFMMRVYRLPV